MSWYNNAKISIRKHSTFQFIAIDVILFYVVRKLYDYIHGKYAGSQMTAPWHDVYPVVFVKSELLMQFVPKIAWLSVVRSLLSSVCRKLMTGGSRTPIWSRLGFQIHDWKCITRVVRLWGE